MFFQNKWSNSKVIEKLRLFSEFEGACYLLLYLSFAKNRLEKY